MIRNERVRDLEAPMQDVVYVALLQAPRREITLIVRTRSEPSAAMPSIRARPTKRQSVKTPGRGFTAWLPRSSAGG
jgi:hypothetical protein